MTPLVVLPFALAPAQTIEAAGFTSSCEAAAGSLVAEVEASGSASGLTG